MSEKIVVFLCRCAENISGAVDFEKLEAHARALGDVTAVAAHDLLCGPAGKEFVVETLRENPVTRVVVAACSIREHEPTFQTCLEQAGLNRYLLAMTNIREHCAWVTGDRDAATEKCCDMTAAAVARARLLRPLEEKKIPICPDLLVIGGGMAGIEAALLAAQADRNVTLVERAPSIGGRAAQIEDAAPELECTACMLAPRMAEIKEAPNIALCTSSEVTDVVGYLGSFRARVHRTARWVKEDFCIGCDECMQACPVEVPNPFDHGLATRKAIYIPFPGATPNCAFIDREACLRSAGEECTKCRDACPMEAVDYDQQDEDFEVAAGALVVATGFESHAPSALDRYGHGKHPNVLTSSEFERLLASDGPTKGRPLLASGEQPRRIAMIHCAGRSELGYCSGICCATALKASLLVNKHGGETEVVHLHTDLMFRGPVEKALLDRAVSKGKARLVHVKEIDAVRLERDRGRYSLLLPAGSSLPYVSADMVVLVTGLVPNSAAARLGELLGARLTDAGFFESDHHFLRPAQTSVEGIEMAGCATGPRNMAESVAQGHAAAGMALARLQPGRELSLEARTANIDDDRCSGCLTCVAVCPFGANEVNPETGRPVTNEVLCKGCGTCVAACPSGAAASRHFGDEQLLAEMKGVLGV